MPRYILIDANSGYAFADTADLNGAARDESPIEAARRFDEGLNEFTRVYEEHGPNYRPNGQSAYHIYRADIEGSEAVPVVHDGQDQLDHDPMVASDEAFEELGHDHLSQGIATKPACPKPPKLDHDPHQSVGQDAPPPECVAAK